MVNTLNSNYSIFAFSLNRADRLCMCVLAGSRTIVSVIEKAQVVNG